MLKGKIAVITGQAGTIGCAAAGIFLEKGASVILCGSGPETEAAARALAEQFPEGKVSGVRTDLSHYAEVEECMDQIREEFGGIDILVNYAGLSPEEGPDGDKAKDFKRLMEYNVEAVFNCSRAAAVHMRRQKSGVIVNAGWLAQDAGEECWYGYAASGAAVGSLTVSMAKELKQDGIRVNAVAVGKGACGDAQGIARLFLFLASSQSSCVTGAVVPAEGWNDVSPRG